VINGLIFDANLNGSQITDQSIMQLLSSASSIARKPDIELSLDASRRTFGALPPSIARAQRLGTT
jgi:hypothetical protein